jgi:spore coat polysaccharide biosynthesis predicted glycosyltransferase SpsG
VSGASRVLFVPVSGAKGAGEFFRCLTIAQRARERWPAIDIRFIVSRAAGYAHEVPFPTVLVDRSPTYESAAVNRAIDELKPDVVIFDSAGRVAQLRHARRRGARTVYVSSRPRTRWKGFRLRRMLQLDQHWLAWPRVLDGRLSTLERLKLWLMRSVSVVFLDCLFPPPDATRAAAYRRELGLGLDPYILFCAGGGGYERQGLSAPEIFGRAAAEVAQSNDIRTVWVGGPNYAGVLAPRPRLLALGALTGKQMIDLLSGANFAVINGGSLLLQALALKIPCIAAPVAGDQDARIRACAARGLLIAAELDFTALATSTLALAGDPARLDQMRARLAQLDLSNGVDTAVAALERLLRSDGTV